MANDITNFSVQVLNSASGKWQTINDRIKVSDYTTATSTYESAVRQAQAEADRQVSNWSSAYPLRSYRAHPIRLDAY